MCVGVHLYRRPRLPILARALCKFTLFPHFPLLPHQSHSTGITRNGPGEGGRDGKVRDSQAVTNPVHFPRAVPPDTARRRLAWLGAAPPRRHAGAPGDLEWPSAACAARGQHAACRLQGSTHCRPSGARTARGARGHGRGVAASPPQGRLDQNSAHIILESRRRKIEFREWP